MSESNQQQRPEEVEQAPEMEVAVEEAVAEEAAEQLTEAEAEVEEPSEGEPSAEAEEAPSEEEASTESDLAESPAESSEEPSAEEGEAEESEKAEASEEAAEAGSDEAAEETAEGTSEEGEPGEQAELPAVLASDDERLALLEAIIYVTEEPLTADQIAGGLALPREVVEADLNRLVEQYTAAHRGIEVRKVAGGYKMYTKAEHHEAVRVFVKTLQPTLKLSKPAFETLAVIAYKQPITVPEIQAIRGVNASGTIHTLLKHKLITSAGRKKVIGKPMMYKTTREFLVQFGLDDLAELPNLKEFEELSRAALGDEEPEETSDETAEEAGGEQPAAEPGDREAALEAQLEAAEDAAEEKAEAEEEAAAAEAADEAEEEPEEAGEESETERQP